MAGLRASFRFAWRELIAEGRRSIFFALLVAVGVASLVGVQGMAGALEAATRAQAKQLMQGDLKISVLSAPTAAQQAALDDLKRDGARITRVWSKPGYGAAGATQAMLDVKGVEPDSWPFYGGLVTEPAKPLADLLATPTDAVVAQEMLDRFGLKVGDSFTLGRTSFRISGRIVQEPQVFDFSQMAFGPRILVSVEGLRAATGEPTGETFLVKLPDSITAEAAAKRLAPAFPGEQTVQTYEQAWEQFNDVMGYVFTFLSMVAFVSLLVGGLGVAMAMRTFIGQKMEQIAVLKAVGATRRRVMMVFLAEAMLLGLLGSLMGALLGLGLQKLLPYVLHDIVPLIPTDLHWKAALGGLVAGTATAVLSALLPVRAVRNVKPDALLRSDSVPVRAGGRVWLETGLVLLVVLGGLGWMTVIYARSAALGLGFLGVTLQASLFLFVVSWLVLKLIRFLPQSGHPALRQAIRSLHAPGSQATAVAVSMGLGIMLITTLYLVQAGLIGQVRAAGTGPDTPNIYVMSPASEQRVAVRSFLEHHAGVAKVQDPILMAQAAIVSVDGKPAAELPLPSFYKGAPLPVAAMGYEVPQGLKLTQGEWFTQDDFGKPYLSLDESFARSADARLGSRMVLRFKEQEVEFTVKAIVAGGSGVRVGVNTPIAAAPGAIDAYTEMYILTAISRPGQESTVIRELMADVPGVTPLGLGEMMNVVDRFLSRLANILRFMMLFAVVAAGVILSGSLSATRFRRRKEAALLKTLGASRATVAFASALENGILGALAGLLGSGLAFGIVSVGGYFLKIPMGGSVWVVGVAALAGAVLAMAVGVVSTLDVLRVKPLAVLRGE